jgi:hypothetical protein
MVWPARSVGAMVVTRTFQEMADEAMAKRYRLINRGIDPYGHDFQATAEELKLMQKEPFNSPFVDHGRLDNDYVGRLCGLRLVLAERDG